MAELGLDEGLAAHQRPVSRINDKRSLIKTNEDEDQSLYRDLSCSVCYTSMADLAKEEQN